MPYTPVLRNKKLLGGQPTLNGYPITIGNLVITTSARGLDDCIKDFEIDPSKRELVKEAIKYCMRGECNRDVMDDVYCHDCVKAQEEGGGINYSKIAKRVYDNIENQRK